MEVAEPGAVAGDRRDVVVENGGELRDYQQCGRADRVGGMMALHQMTAGGEVERDEALVAWAAAVAVVVEPLPGQAAVAVHVRARVGARSA